MNRLEYYQEALRHTQNLLFAERTTHCFAKGCNHLIPAKQKACPDHQGCGSDAHQIVQPSYYYNRKLWDLFYG